MSLGVVLTGDMSDVVRLELGQKRAHKISSFSELPIASSMVAGHLLDHHFRVPPNTESRKREPTGSLKADDTSSVLDLVVSDSPLHPPTERCMYGPVGALDDSTDSPLTGVVATAPIEVQLRPASGPDSTDTPVLEGIFSFVFILIFTG